MHHNLPFHVIPVLSASTWKNFSQNNTPYTSAPLLSYSLGMKAQHYLISEFGGKGRIALSLLSALLFLVKKKSSFFCFLASSSKDTQQAKTCDRKILNKSFGGPIKIPFSICNREVSSYPEIMKACWKQRWSISKSTSNSSTRNTADTLILN